MADNGVEPMDTEQRTANYDVLLGQGFSAAVASELDKLFARGQLAANELNDQAYEQLLQGFPDDEQRLGVLKQFGKADLTNVQNKSAFLSGVIKTYKSNLKAKQAAGEAPLKHGPEEAKIKELLDRTGYTLDITSGQRRYHKPRPEGEDAPVKIARSQIYLGKLPRDSYEDELIPLLEKCGEIREMRLMIDPSNGLNKGFAFAVFMTSDGASEAVKQLNDYKLKSKSITAVVSAPNDRLYIGSIPKNKSKEDIKTEFGNVLEGLIDVIIYQDADKKFQNRGFCFLEFEDHKAAAVANKKLNTGKIRVWNQVNYTCSWAEQLVEPDEETMAKVKVVYIRGLPSSADEDKLKDLFLQFGDIEKVKKIKDYAFVHFTERDNAIRAIEEMNSQEIEGATIECSLAKPQSKDDKNKRQQQRGGQQYGRGGGYGGGSGDYGYGYDSYGYPADYYGYEYGAYGAGYDPYYGMPPRGGRGGPAGRGPRGGRGGPRGGPRGGMLSPRGGGPRGAPRGRGGAMRGGRGMGGKRKPEGQAFGDPKRRNTQSDWSSSPIAQQPYGGKGYGSAYPGYGDDYSAQWYSDYPY